MWFVSQVPHACACFAFVFAEVYALGAGETITQQYRLVIVNGGWDTAQVEAAAEAWVKIAKM